MNVESPAAPAPASHDPFAQAILRVVPTTEGQREIWLADRLDREASLAYNEALSIHFDGVLDQRVLKQALDALVQRHDALRSVLSGDGQTLCVLDQATIAMPVEDVSGIEAAGQGARIACAEQESVAQPFDLQDGPLFRAALFRLGPQSHRLVLSAHHAVCDGWSWWVIVRDLGELYSAAIDGRSVSLPAVESFADHALAEASQSSSDSVTDERYWRQRFADGAPVLELPLDLPRPAHRHFASHREDLELTPELLHALRETAAKQGVSLFSLMLTAFGLLVSRIAGQDDVVVAIPSAGQPASGKLAMVGHCANTLPMRFMPARNETFAAFLARANSDLLDGLEHRDYTLSTLLQQLAIARDPSRVPLAPLLFNIDQSLDGERGAFAGAHIECHGVARIADNFELSLNAVQTTTGMRLECQYGASLFQATTVRRWLHAYRTLLQGIGERVDRPCTEYPFLDGAGLRELAALSPAATPFHRERLMHQHFEATCDRQPDAIAAHDGQRSIHYGELERKANRIAHLLSAHGVRPGDLVGIAVDRGIPMLASLLGILKSGAGYIPLDPAFPQARLQHMLDDGRPSAVLTTQALAASLPLQHQGVVLLDEAALSAQPDTRPVTAHAIDPEAIAYVIYTSGSTGTPKGVEIPHRAVANFLESMAGKPGLGGSDVLVAVTTLSFDIAVLELMLPLTVGAQVVIPDRDTTLDGNALAACIDKHHATVMQATPATWRMLIEAGWMGGTGFRILCGGEPLPATLATQLLARCGELWNVYGPTETTVWSTCARITNPVRGTAPDIHIGQPIANTGVWILDDARLPCVRGVPGELCISGEGLARGYRNQPALTADRFIDWNGPDGRIRLYRTGDRARWRNDGMLEHLGRLDHQIKLRGYRIELGEIETRLAAHPDVQSAIALVRDEGEGDARLVAYVVAGQGRDIDAGQLKTHLRGTLPDYMIPQHVMALARWPLTANGKIDRKSLPVPGTPEDGQAASALPETSLQERLLDAFKGTLKLGTLGIDDDFFLSGGHSLLAAQLTTRLNKEFSLRLSQRTLFDAPTVRKLSSIIESETVKETEGQIASIPRRSQREWAPLSIFQQRQALIHEFHPEVLAYSLPSGHVLTGPFNIDYFRQALVMVMNRQTVLRTSFERRGDDLVQIVRDGLESRVLEPPVDLTHLAPSQRQEALDTEIRTLVARPFDSLAEAPLFRSRLYRMSNDEHVWFFMPHQIIWDGWSFDLLYAELSECYAALCEGHEPSLPALPVEYGDYAVWHNAWMESDAYRAQREQWRKWMCMPNARGGWPRALPTDHPRPRLMTGTATAIPLDIPQELSQSLRETAKSLDSTVFVVMLAAWFVTLANYGGDSDIVVGTPVRGRNHAETEPLMGHIVNLLPVRMDVPMAGEFGDVVRMARSALLDSLSAPDIQLEDIAEMRSGLPGAASSILYHAQFSFQDIRDRVTHWGELSHKRFDIDQPSIAEDLNLWVVDRGMGGLQGTLLYNKELLEEATARRIASIYGHLLAGLANDPRHPIEAALHSHNDENIDMPPTTTASIASTPMASGSRLDYLQDLWERHLGVSVGPEDNFFDLGGSSMQAVRVLTELAKDTGVKLRLPQLAVMTAAEIAGQLPERSPEPSSSGWFKRMFGRK